jgi:hypothetical protein
MSQRNRPLSRRRGIALNDWVTVICLGFFFFFMGAIILSIFLSVDPKSTMPMTITKQPLVFIVLALITTGLLDLGAICVFSGWKGRHKASTINLGGDDLNINNPLGMATDGGSMSGEQNIVRSISSGMSGIFKIYMWVQRITAALIVIIMLLATAIWWLISVLDLMSGNKSLNGGLFIILGLVLVTYIVIIYFMLVRKPAAT